MWFDQDFRQECSSKWRGDAETWKLFVTETTMVLTA